MPDDDEARGGAPARLDLSLSERADLDRNDLGNAWRLLAEYGDELLYMTGRGWAVFDGRRYSFADGDSDANKLATELPALIREERDWTSAEWQPPEAMIAARIAAAANPARGSRRALDRDAARDELRKDKAEALEKWAVRSGDNRRVTDALHLARPFRRKFVAELDADPFALIVGNGQVDLRLVLEGAPDPLVAVDRGSSPTRRAGVEYDAAATCPRWLAFVDLVLPDEAVRLCAQRIFGAMLFGRNREQIAVILRGSGGNGKSTFLQVLARVLGRDHGYAETCQVELLIRTREKAQGAATPDEIDLPGARAYFANEPDERDVLSGKKIKNLTGGDPRMSRANFAVGFFKWTPHGIPVVSCNGVPRIVDTDEGLRRRLIFLPFEVRLDNRPDRREQREIVDELAAEGSGILNWLVEGFRQFMEIGTAPPPWMLELKTEIMAEADTVPVFLEEFTKRDADGRIPQPDLNKTYAAWCLDEGHYARSPPDVAKRIRALGFETKRVRGINVWVGLAWNETGEHHAARATRRDDLGAIAPLAPREVDDDEPPF